MFPFLNICSATAGGSADGGGDNVRKQAHDTRRQKIFSRQHA